MWNIYHTERVFGGATHTRREGGPDGFATQAEAVAYMWQMQDGAPTDYAEALHVEPADIS